MIPCKPNRSATWSAKAVKLRKNRLILYDTNTTAIDPDLNTPSLNWAQICHDDL